MQRTDGDDAQQKVSEQLVKSSILNQKEKSPESKREASRVCGGRVAA